MSHTSRIVLSKGERRARNKKPVLHLFVFNPNLSRLIRSYDQLSQVKQCCEHRTLLLDALNVVTASAVHIILSYDVCTHPKIDQGPKEDDDFIPYEGEPKSPDPQESDCDIRNHCQNYLISKFKRPAVVKIAPIKTVRESPSMMDHKHVKSSHP